MTGFFRGLDAALAPLLAVAALLAPAACPSGASAAGKPLELTLAFTGDVGGYLEPCG